MKIFSLLETQYNSFVLAVKEYLSKTLSDYDSNYGNTTVFGQLINVLGGVIQNMMLYLEDSMTEQNKWTAQRKKSIYGLASQTGYKPSLGKAAGVQLKLAFVPNNLKKLQVMIRNHEMLTCTQNGLPYNIILPQEVVLLNPQIDASTRYFYAVEGRFESQTFVSSGGKYWTRNFQFVGNLDADYMTVQVNDETWDYEPSLYDMTADGKQYTYKVGFSGGIDLVFGNDVHGRALKDGDVIKVTYLIHDGEGGNLDPHNETYFVFNNSLEDVGGDLVDGNTVFNVTFGSEDGITSGSNSESITSVRENIGYNSRSLVLASPENYKNYLNKFSFVGYNRTWSEPGSMIVNTLAMKNYQLNLSSGKDYFNLKESDFLLSDLQKSSIVNSIKNSGSQIAGVTYNILDPEICKYSLSVYVKPKSNKYDKVYMKNQIRNVVGEFFSDIVSDQYIPTSDVERAILDKVEGIDGINCYFLSAKNEMALMNGKYTQNIYKWNPLTNKYDISTETVYLYNGENPGLGLDAHGNIFLSSDFEFPALLGGWQWKPQVKDDDISNDDDLITVEDPLNIIFE